MSDKKFTITNDKSPTAYGGREFGVRIIDQGDHYGRDDVLVHDKADPMIEFHSGTQFVSRYYLSTLNERCLVEGAVEGLSLDGGVPQWTVDESAMEQVREHLVERGYIDAPSAPKPF